MKIWIPVFIRNAIIRYAKKTPYFDLPGYMERWWVAHLGREKSTNDDGYTVSSLDIRVHHILRSDEDLDPHNHPWPFVSIILFGGYWENRPVFNEYDDSEIVGYTRVWHGPGSILFRRATDFHYLELPEGKTAWTLFITGKWIHTWGFLVETPHSAERSEFMPWRDYLARKEKKA